MLNACTEPYPFSLQKVAAAIAHAASHRSHIQTARTPFEKHARQAGTFYLGGKMDDITVVAAWVVRPGTEKKLMQQ
jgi:hypothetical protein